MKTSTKMILAGLATAFFTAGSSIAGDLQVVDNHHGSYVYLYPARTAETSATRGWTTFAFFGRGNGVGNSEARVQRAEKAPRQSKLGIHEVQTGQGTVSYYAPAE